MSGVTGFDEVGSASSSWITAWVRPDEESVITSVGVSGSGAVAPEPSGFGLIVGKAGAVGPGFGPGLGSVSPELGLSGSGLTGLSGSPVPGLPGLPGPSGPSGLSGPSGPSGPGSILGSLTSKGALTLPAASSAT